MIWQSVHADKTLNSHFQYPTVHSHLLSVIQEQIMQIGHFTLSKSDYSQSFALIKEQIM